MAKRITKTTTALAAVSAAALVAAACSVVCSVGCSVPDVVAGDPDLDAGTTTHDTGAPTADGSVASEASTPDTGAVADGAVDTGTCVADAANDPHNCGRCGHDCQGGACKASVCQPFELVPSRPGPWYVAVDDTRVYWADRGDDQILAADKNDGSGITVLANAEAGGVYAPWTVAVDATNVYWTNGLDAASGGGVRRLPKVNSTGEGAVVASAEYPRSLALDGTSLYFTEHENGRVKSVAKTATNASGTLVGSTGGNAEQVVVDATNVYWSDSFRFPDIGARVAKAPRTGLADGGVSALVATDQIDIFGIAQDDANLYWTINSGPPSTLGAVRSAPKTAVNGAGVQLVSTSNNPTFVTVSNGEIFWAEQGDWVSISDAETAYDYPEGRLLACKLPGCTGGVRVVAAQQHNMQNIVATADALYWVQYGLDKERGKIMKVVR